MAGYDGRIRPIGNRSTEDGSDFMLVSIVGREQFAHCSQNRWKSFDIAHVGIGRQTGDVFQGTSPRKKHDVEIWKTGELFGLLLQGLYVPLVLHQGIIKTIFRFSEVQQLRPILLPLMAEQPAAVILHFDNDQALGRGNNQVYLGIFSVPFLHIQVVEDGLGVHSSLQHLNDQLAFGRGASVGGRHGREQLHISPLAQIRSYKTANNQGYRYDICHPTHEKVSSYAPAFIVPKDRKFFQNIIT